LGNIEVGPRRLRRVRGGGGGSRRSIRSVALDEGKDSKNADCWGPECSMPRMTSRSISSYSGGIERIDGLRLSGGGGGGDCCLSARSQEGVRRRQLCES